MKILHVNSLLSENIPAIPFKMDEIKVNLLSHYRLC
jgi:hypothetical protein